MKTRKINRKVSDFISDYGKKQLISLIDGFRDIVGAQDYFLYCKLVKKTCDTCGIAPDKLKRTTNLKGSTCKRVISYIAFTSLKFPVSTIALLFNMSERIVNYYIRDCKEWLKKSSIIVIKSRKKRMFTETYIHVINIIK